MSNIGIYIALYIINHTFFSITRGYMRYTKYKDSYPREYSATFFYARCVRKRAVNTMTVAYSFLLLAGEILIVYALTP